ncbi:Craniofacial development protein 2 [Mytilus edulis]|uniref:Craniofacial development protein 2 n=1 Tax=Mytilus edulis TaxID=6550 RepID=A0A8S3S0T4_MYTED|nr:Craniofacial development protein 2 [Mytilus edulis]
MTRRPMKLFSPKYPTKIGTWNVRTLYQSGKSLQTAKEMDRYSIEILGLSEVRWNTSGMTTLNTGHTIIYSGNKNATDTHDKGVGFMLTKKAKQSLLEWNPVSSRIITARFDTKFQKTTIIQVYSPTNNADEEEKDDFYNSLQTTVNSVPKRDILMIIGDLNAKVGKDRTGREREMGPNGIGEMNENGEIFADFCAVNSLVIIGTLFPHKNCHKVTWVSPNGVTENQIDHIAISQRWRSSLQDVRNKRGADIASDHHLIIAKIQLKLLSTKKAKSRRKKFNVDLFKDPKVVQDYHILLQNKFSVLENLHDDETSINTAWEMTRDSIVQACEETVGYLQQNRKQWM